MSMNLIKKLLRRLSPPELYVCGNLESCLIEFDGEVRVYGDFHNRISDIVEDFELKGRKIRVKTKKTSYRGHEYHRMHREKVSDFREQLKKRGVKVIYE